VTIDDSGVTTCVEIDPSTRRTPNRPSATKTSRGIVSTVTGPAGPVISTKEPRENRSPVRAHPVTTISAAATATPVVRTWTRSRASSIEPVSSHAVRSRASELATTNRVNDSSRSFGVAPTAVLSLVTPSSTSRGPQRLSRSVDSPGAS